MNIIFKIIKKGCDYLYILRIPPYTTDIAYLIITNRIFMGFWFYFKTSKYIIYLGKITSYDIDLRHML